MTDRQNNRRLHHVGLAQARPNYTCIYVYRVSSQGLQFKELVYSVSSLCSSRFLSLVSSPFQLIMAHWDAYYESSSKDDQYTPLSTTISCGASHFNSGGIGNDFSHAVANTSGACASSRTRGLLSHYRDSDTLLCACAYVVRLVPRPHPLFNDTSRIKGNIEKLGVAWGRGKYVCV